MTLGDARWEAAHGRLSAVERWRYALATVAARVRTLAPSFGRARRASALREIDLNRVVFPDSTCALAAQEKLRALATPALFNHSLRSYIWGSLLGQLDGRRWDEEILFVGAMMHDLGLTEALHASCPGAVCFTLDGAYGAADVFAHATDERAERMRRAVLLHLNVDVPGELHGWEAHYLQAGAFLDAVGRRFEELPRETITATLERHPRLQLKDEVVALVRRESRLRPGSRMAVLDRLGVRGLVRRAPFES